MQQMQRVSSVLAVLARADGRVVGDWSGPSTIRLGSNKLSDTKALINDFRCWFYHIADRAAQVAKQPEREVLRSLGHALDPAEEARETVRHVDLATEADL